MSSSNKVDYSIRINKSIERKIISEGIANIKSVVNCEYSYIGFGALWFVDFVYFHKNLHICDMYSIERDRIIYERARYNIPYKCIDLRLGESTIELPKIFEKCDNPTITWLDYDGKIFECPSFQPDLDTIISQSKSGSIVLVTMNVNNSKVKTFKNDPNQPAGAWKERIKELLRRTFGLVDLENVQNNQLIDQDRFIDFAATLYSQSVANSIYKSGNKKVFKKIFDFSYADNAEMITQGFIILDDCDKDKLDALNKFQAPYFLNATPFRIEAPVLTPRERHQIDKLLPSNVDGFIGEQGTFEYGDLHYLNTGALGFPLDINKFKSYTHLYKFYPTYSEVMNS